jgi:hypothetical protein
VSNWAIIGNLLLRGTECAVLPSKPFPRGSLDVLTRFSGDPNFASEIQTKALGGGWVTTMVDGAVRKGGGNNGDRFFHLRLPHT